MPALWSHRTSVTRDFVILSLVIVFIAILASIWLAFETYEDQSVRIALDLDKEAVRVDDAFHSEIIRAEYLLEAIGRQIVRRGTSDKRVIAQMLSTYDLENDFYSRFVWIDETQMVVTSSREGVLEEPIDVSERGYVKNSLAEPFKVQIGQPKQGKISKRLILPMAMGLTDFTGKYIGTVMLSLNMEVLTRTIQKHIKTTGVAFAVTNEALEVLTQNAKGEQLLTTDFLSSHMKGMKIEPRAQGVISSPELVSKERALALYRYSLYHPYVAFVGSERDWSALSKTMLPRLLQLMFVAAFLVSLLWLVRFRVIYPVQTLAESSAEIARGNTHVEVPKGGPLEISVLSQHLQNIADYITERKRIEEELVAKVLALKAAKDIAEVTDQAKMEILSSLRQEIFPAMEQILNAASIFQEQPYGAIRGDEYTKCIDALDKSSAHLTEVIHEVFEFPKLDHQGPVVTRKPVDVNGLIHKCTNLLGATLALEDVTVNINIQDDLPKLAINELHLTHVIMHILIACIHSISAGGELTVEASLEESGDATEFVIMFKDNGSGLDTQYIASLWRANEQGHRTGHLTQEEEREAAHGAIALTKKIITLHNGRLTVQNPPGKEAIIAVYFQQ